MKNMYKNFNNKESLIVISSYPEKNSEPAKLNAVACYVKNLLNRYKSRKIIVVSDILEKGEPYKRNNILTIPSWKPANIKQYLGIINTIRKFPKVKDILIQFEFNMLGSVILTSLLPFLILLFRLMGKKVTVMQHQVVDDLTQLSGHLNVKKHTLKANLLNFGLRGFYVLLGMFSNSIIVHEEILKTRLSKWVNSSKIYVVSHGLETNLTSGKSRKTIRKELGYKNNDFVLLVFGYIAWYKGVDWLIKKVFTMNQKYPNKNIKLIVAGGASATLKSKAHYRKYLAKVESLINENKKIIKATGFVPENDVYKYFSACDLVVLPYRAMMSASGPLSFALKYKKPFMISDTLKSSFENNDFSRALEKSGINKEDISFALTKTNFDNKLLGVVENGKLVNRMVLLSSILRQLRSWENIALEYETVIGKKSMSMFTSFKSLLGGLISRRLSYNTVSEN